MLFLSLQKMALINPFEALLLGDEESLNSDNEASASSAEGDEERVSQ
jgi:hypothetical protein